MTKYLLLLGLCALMLSSCATGDYASLERRVDVLEKSKGPTRDPMLLAEQAGARKFWWRNALTEGTDALDAISHTILADGDAAFVMTKSGTTTTGYLFVYDEDAGDVESSPLIIAPDSGGGRWFLVNFNVAVMTSNAVDGTHYFQAVNTVAFSGTPAEGMCYWKDTASNENDLCCYDADASTWRCHSFD